MKRYVSFLLASVLPLSLFAWFAPTPMNQLDFLILWVVAMLLLALPMVYAEIALAYRSELPPLTGLQKLTREADASTIWRGFSWLSALVAILLAGKLVATAGLNITPMLTDMGISLPVFAVIVGLMVVAMIASAWGIMTALVGLLLVVVGFVLNLDSGMTGVNLQMTNVTLAEWGRAVMMALVSVGAGSGLYWSATHHHTNQAGLKQAGLKTEKKSATKAVLPIWAVQVVVGILVLILLSMTGQATGDITAETGNAVGVSTASMISSIGFVCVASVLLNFASQLFISQFASASNGKNSNPLTKHIPTVKGILITLVIACALVLIPNTIKQMALVLLTTASVLMLSIFTGWKMKISHLRKSMNFGSELTYNLWRVAVRLVVPIGILAGLLGWVMAWIG